MTDAPADATAESRAGALLLPRPPSPPLAAIATLDARGAAALALRNYLACLDFKRWGGDTAPDDVFRFKAVRDEWPEPSESLDYPVATVLDREDDAFDAHSFIPTALEETWGRFAPDTVLWKTSELSASLQVDVWCNDAPTREAIAARLPSAFAPGDDTGRIVLSGSDRYYCRPVRASLKSLRRMDMADAVYVRERRLVCIVRVDVDVVDLRCAVAYSPSVRLEVRDTPIDSPPQPPEERVDLVCYPRSR